MNKVLVTGANGFIGRHLVQELVKQNAQVRVLLRSRDKAEQLPANIEIVIGDLTNRASLNNLCKDVRTVYHLAGFAHAFAQGNDDFAHQHVAVNYHGTENLLKEALKSQVENFIYFSTVKVDETSPYGLAKKNAEALLMQACQENPLHVCILRPSLVYGPNWKGNLDQMLRAIDKGIFLPLPKVSNRRSMVSVHDICQAAILAAEDKKARGKIYTVTDGQAYSSRQLYEAMLQALNKPIPKWYVPLWFFRGLAYVGDILALLLRRRMPFNSEAMTKLFESSFYDSTWIQQELGFKAHYNFYSMLPNIVTAYREQKT